MIVIHGFIWVGFVLPCDMEQETSFFGTGKTGKTFQAPEWLSSSIDREGLLPVNGEQR